MTTRRDSAAGRPTQAEKADRFLRRHRGETPLIVPNPWDVGSARLFEALGFEGLATTSSGFAASLGHLDHGVSRDQALEHCAALAGAVDLPVSADLERCYADDPAGVAETVALAVETGLAGCSVEDFNGDRTSAEGGIYPIDLAVERVAAAVEAAHRGPVHFVLTARAENHLHGRDDLDDTITRLRRFAEAGADVLFAPGVRDAADIERLVAAVDLPVNVLALPGVPTVPELGRLGVARVSVGGSLAFAAYGTAITAARALLESGDYTFRDAAGVGRTEIFRTFAP